MTTDLLEERCASLLLALADESPTFRVFFGFDGYVDSIKRVVQKRFADGSRLHFKSIADFASQIAQGASKSAEFELEMLCQKIGGNAPLMARAAANLGLWCTCVGAMGYPELLPIFLEDTVANLQLLSVAESAKTDAFEFDDGKLMFGENASISGLNWDTIVARLLLQDTAILTLLVESQLIAVLNWSCIQHNKSIVGSIIDCLSQVLEPDALANKLMFFDFSDFSAVEPAMVAQWLQVIKQLPCKCIVSLNLKEAQILHAITAQSFDGPSQLVDIATLCKNLDRELGIALVLIHDRDASYACGDQLSYQAPGFFVDSPYLSTGGGDNFNAGFAFGLLNGFAIPDCLLLANAVSSLYVSSGQSPDLKKVRDLLILQQSIYATKVER